MYLGTYIYINMQNVENISIISDRFDFPQKLSLFLFHICCDIILLSQWLCSM